MEARIVVIDNDERMRDLMTLRLKAQGHQVFGYAYAHIYLVTLKQHRPDLIVLDFKSGDGGMGWEFLQLLRMDDTTTSIPILVTTTPLHLTAVIRNYLLTRSIRVLYKRLDLDSFLTVVEETLTQGIQAHTLFSGDQALPILVVDDTDDIRENVAEILRLEGYPVETANNGVVALDTLSRAAHSLILLDMAMPVMNGYAFISAYARQLPPHTSVIIFSGETDIVTRDLPSFVVDVLTKPFQVTGLLQVVEKYANLI